MQIGFVSLGMGKATLEEALAVGQLAGCEVFELNGRPTVHRNLWAPPIDYAAIKARVARAGVVPTSLGGYSNFAQPTDEGLAAEVEQFVGYCRVAREMGIPVVRAFAGEVVAGYTLDQLYPRLVAGFKAITARVADWGLKIGIENHSHLINDGDRLFALIHEVGSPILGLTLDTGNFCWAGHSLDAAHRFFEKLAPLTVNVHIKDGRFVSGEWVLTPAGRGDLDLPWLLKTLRAAGYDGPVLSEYEGPADFVASTLESVAYLRGLRNALR
ncbi:MAG: sugar phosphate isomerase/epimerase [Chloroflexota bacterium]